ncbi:hypothetical protein Tco_1358011 [Tanacetum coccineum]
MTTVVEHIIVAGAGGVAKQGKTNGRMMLDSIDNGPLVYPTIKENGHTRPKKYSELTEAQQLQDDCDVQATNIILHGLPPDVYALVNHQEGEILYEYYWRFSQLINDMHTIGMTMQQVQVNTKSLNAFPPEWSKFVTDQGDNLIDCINKAMVFLFTMASRFPPLNNQLRTSSNPRNQATIQDGRVTVQGRQTQSFADTGNRGIATTSRGNYAAAEAQEAGQILDEEKLAFIADPGIAEVQVAQ